MPAMVELRVGPLFRVLVATTAAYAGVAALANTPWLILAFNGISMSISAGVCVAYAPVFWGALAARQPTRGDHLGCGIFLVSSSMLGQRLLSVIARDLGWPAIYNTSWMTFVIYLALIGGALHLWAPDAVEGRIPRKHWVSTGIVAALSFFVTFVLWNAHLSHIIHPSVQLE